MEVQMNVKPWREVLRELAPSSAMAGSGCLVSTLSGPVNFRKRRDIRVRLLNAILRNKRAWLYYSEDPVSDGVTGDWARIGPGKLRLSCARDIPALYAWLRQGAWVLVVEPRAPEIDDVFAGDPFSVEDLAAAVLHADADVIVSAFHDNDPWWIVVREPIAS